MTHTVLVIGATDVGRRTCAALQDRGTSVIHLASPTDTELRELLLSDVSGVAIMLHNDIEALRYALTAHSPWDSFIRGYLRPKCAS